MSLLDNIVFPVQHSLLVHGVRITVRIPAARRQHVDVIRFFHKLRCRFPSRIIWERSQNDKEIWKFVSGKHIVWSSAVGSVTWISLILLYFLLLLVQKGAASCSSSSIERVEHFESSGCN